MTDKRKTCLICGSDDNKSVYPKFWESLYYSCNACGHQWELQSDYRDQGEFYFEDESYFYFSPFSQWISSCVARQRIDMVKRYLKTGLLLEIGPGTGEVILAAEEEGFDVVAAENSKVFVNYLRSKTKASIYHGPFEDADFGKTKFDGILSFHVLEHLLNPTSHLQRTFEVTKPGGYLFLATPNASSWDRRLCQNRWTGYSMGHVNLFSISSIKHCLERAGWKIVGIYTIEFPFELLWSVKVMIKPKEITPQSAGSNVKRIPLQLGRIILTLFGALTKPIRFVQERLGGGNEIFVVAQRDKP
mgnify:CR=1 FL=1